MFVFPFAELPFALICNHILIAKRIVISYFTKFLSGRGHQVPPIYSVDSTSVEKWDEAVSSPAIEVVQSFIKVGRNVSVRFCILVVTSDL